MKTFDRKAIETLLAEQHRNTRHDDLKLSGEDYFNQTFKQEQK